VNYHFSDGGWLLIANDLIQARSLAWVKLLVYIGATVFAVLLTVWLFIGRRKQEYGILRALGMSKREAGARLYIPFLILSAVSTVVGLAAARIVTARELMGDHAPAELSLFLLGALGFLILLAVIAFLSLLLIHRRSILELTQEQKS